MILICGKSDVNVENQLLTWKADEKLGKPYNHPTLRAQIADEDLARWRSPHNRPRSKRCGRRVMKASNFKWLQPALAALWPMTAVPSVLYGRGFSEITATPLVLPSLDNGIYGTNMCNFDT